MGTSSTNWALRDASIRAQPGKRWVATQGKCETDNVVRGMPQEPFSWWQERLCSQNPVSRKDENRNCHLMCHHGGHDYLKSIFFGVLRQKAVCSGGGMEWIESSRKRCYVKVWLWGGAMEISFVFVPLEKLISVHKYSIYVWNQSYYLSI